MLLNLLKTLTENQFENTSDENSGWIFRDFSKVH